MSNVSTASHKGLETIIKIVSIALPLIVALLFRVKINIPLPFSPYLLPAINAGFNGATAVLLIAAVAAAKAGKIQVHARLIYTGMLLSLLFLLGYVLYHLTTEHTRYAGDMRGLYLTLLFSHIALAAIQAPFVLYAFFYGYTGQIERHRKIVKLAFPIWLYVSVTGVICYWMISPFYPAQ